MAGYFKYEPPESALRKKTELPESRWSKAVENTLAIGMMMGVGVDKN